MGDIVDHETRILALPRGYITATTLATAFTTTSTSAVDVTGLSVTFTAVAGRQYKISFSGSTSNSGANASQFYITKVSTALAEGYSFSTNVTTSYLYAIDSPAAGSVTYKIQFFVGAGTGTMYGTSTRASIAARMLVEDIGLA